MRFMPASGTKPALKNYVELGSLTVEEPPTAEGRAPAPRSVAPDSDRACAKEDRRLCPPGRTRRPPRKPAGESGLHQLSKSLTHRPEPKPALRRSALGPAREFYGPAPSSVNAALSEDAAPAPASSPPIAAKRRPTAMGVPPAVARRSPTAARPLPAAVKLSSSSAGPSRAAVDRRQTTASRSPRPVRRPSALLSPPQWTANPGRTYEQMVPLELGVKEITGEGPQRSSLTTEPA